MVSILIAGDKNNTVSVIAKKEDIPALSKVLTSKPKIDIIDPQDPKAQLYINKAYDAVMGYVDK